jgi:hypothetical protein
MQATFSFNSKFSLASRRISAWTPQIFRCMQSKALSFSINCFSSMYLMIGMRDVGLALPPVTHDLH